MKPKISGKRCRRCGKRAAQVDLVLPIMHVRAVAIPVSVCRECADELALILDRGERARENDQG